MTRSTALRIAYAFGFALIVVIAAFAWYAVAQNNVPAAASSVPSFSSADEARTFLCDANNVSAEECDAFIQNMFAPATVPQEESSSLLDNVQREAGVAPEFANKVYEMSAQPMYTIGMDTSTQEYRDVVLTYSFDPTLEKQGEEMTIAARSFQVDGILLGDCVVAGQQVWSPRDNEGEVTYLPAGTSASCQWWGRWYPASALRGGDALTREFLAGCADSVGCERMAWHWLDNGVVRNAYFESIEALYTTQCGFWVGMKMPAGLSCMVESGKTATVLGSNFLTVPDGTGTWTAAPAGQTTFLGQNYLYSPAEFQVVSYQ